MGSTDGKYGIEHALGNATVPRISNPTIRGSVRRADPDGGHPSPYFLGLNTKTLIVAVTPVGGNITVTFTSDDMDAAIVTINAASPANLQGSDEDGYLRITNLNTGAANSIIVKGGTGLDILGFLLDPEPGSASYAGELKTSSAGRGITTTQNNPHGTSLVAQDENLTSEVLNRAIYGMLRHVERVGRGLDIEVPIVKKIAVTVVSHVPTGKKVFVVQDDTLRFPIQGFGITGNPASTIVFDKLVNMRTTGDLDFIDPTNANSYLRVSAVYYNDGTNATADNTTNFATWGTLDGKSIFASQTKNKQAAVSISAIRGNIIVAPTALFQTNVCQPGDTIVIESATNTLPFSHLGEFIITEIFNETKIAVRPKSVTDPTFISSVTPTELNANLPGGTSYGTVRVVVGATLPMSDLMFEVDAWAPLGSYFARVLCFKRIRDLVAGDLGELLNPGNGGLGTLLNTHFTGAAAHSAANITAAAISGATYSLGASTVYADLVSIIGFLNALPAANIAYAGGANWRDGTTNPATTVEAQLDKIITDLKSDSGADFTGIFDSTTWADGTSYSASELSVRINAIMTSLASTGGTSKIQGIVSGTDIVEARLDTQIADLAANWLKMSRNNTISGLQTFSGLITAGAGLTASANQHVTVSGTGRHKHGDVVLNIQPFSGQIQSNWVGDDNGYLLSTGAGNVRFGIPLLVGHQITSITFELFGDGAADLTGEISFRPKNSTKTTDFTITITNPPASWVDNTYDVTDHTMADGDVYWMRLTSSAANLQLGTIRVTYSHP